ncbi:MAG: winged helix-turn-helix domain-containing protein [Candidatus Binatia bacterium]
MRLGTNFWLEENGKVVLSEWRVALLEAVERTGSINAAAIERGVHFRVAWRKLKEMEEGLGVKLTQRTVGGARGGGTCLTAEGREQVRHFREFTDGLKAIIEKRYQKTFGHRDPSYKGGV